MSRRKLLLCSAPVVLALAALVWALARDGRCEAERRAEGVRVGMSVEEAKEVLDGPETKPSRLSWANGPGGSAAVWEYPDGSEVWVGFEFKFRPQDGPSRVGTFEVVGKQVLPPPPWHERLRDRLRQLGLPV